MRPYLDFGAWSARSGDGIFFVIWLYSTKLETTMIQMDAVAGILTVIALSWIRSGPTIPTIGWASMWKI
jgi:hypothetical protein